MNNTINKYIYIYYFITIKLFKLSMKESIQFNLCDCCLLYCFLKIVNITIKDKISTTSMTKSIYIQYTKGI